MASFNKVILVGNLTRDPVLRHIPNGTAVTELGLAVSRQWTDQNSRDRKEETTFVDVTLWGKTAEIAAKWLSKGRPVLIEGRLQMDEWEDKETGKKRTKLKVVGENMTMLGGGKGDDSGSGYSGQQSGPSRSTPSTSSKEPDYSDPAASFYDDEDDSVPF